jgi:hypothetical protein
MRRRAPSRFAVLALAGALFAAACDGVDRENISDRIVPTAPAPSPTLPSPATPPTVASGACDGSPIDYASAQQNAISRRNLLWSPFGRPEYGWETYAPRIAQTIGTLCPADTPGFAQALARWQESRRLPADGVLKPEVFDSLKNEWHRERPYIAVRGAGICPDAPPEARLAVARVDEGYKGKIVLMRPAVLQAYRRMKADARAADPAIRADPELLTVFSAYRSPESDAERCAREGNCDGIRRASCSVHRTGLALDLMVGQAPGHPVDSTADPNRLAMSRNPAYLWLVRNAGRYGFVNYAFEPWHWEYVGETITPPSYNVAGPRADPTPSVGGGTVGGRETFLREGSVVKEPASAQNRR